MTQETNSGTDFLQNAAQFMQAGQNMLQQFMGAVGQMSSMNNANVQIPQEAQLVTNLQREYALKQMELWQSIMQKQQGI